MQLNPAEISEQIKSRIQGLVGSTDVRNQGTVISVTDGICRIYGLSDVMQGEMLEFPATKDGAATYGLALIKRSLNASLNNSFDQQLELERDLQRLAGRSEDYREGISAFMEKRSPSFKGR